MPADRYSLILGGMAKVSHADPIKAMLKRMSHPAAVDPAKKYYVFHYTATLDGQVQIGVQTMWVGFENGDTSRELRKARVESPASWLVTWAKLKEPFLVVNETHEIALLMREGGNALVATTVAEQMLPSFLKPQLWPTEGALPVVTKPKEARQRAPTPKLRGAVLKRDHFRCRMCGQRPADDVNVQLDVHHVIPWEDGGLTEKENLITLCLACHKGLRPHFEPKLFELLSEEDAPDQSLLRRTPKVKKVLYAYSWQKSFEVVADCPLAPDGTSKRTRKLT